MPGRQSGWIAVCHDGSVRERTTKRQEKGVGGNEGEEASKERQEDSDNDDGDTHAMRLIAYEPWRTSGS
jgi:hypothetical protein